MISHVLLQRGGSSASSRGHLLASCRSGCGWSPRSSASSARSWIAPAPQEVLLPMVHPGRAVAGVGRWEKYGPELLRIKDRKSADFVIRADARGGRSRDLVRARRAQSYRQLPLNLYQIQDKFRDELRPRVGLMRGREFIMKDAYSFHADRRGRAARVQEHVRRVRAHLQALRARVPRGRGRHRRDRRLASHEFLVLADSGEDAIVVAATRATTRPTSRRRELSPRGRAAGRRDRQARRVAHPGQGRRSRRWSKFSKCRSQRFVKTLIYIADGKPVIALCAATAR